VVERIFGNKKKHNKHESKLDLRKEGPYYGSADW
jgi:hypothetical protein